MLDHGPGYGSRWAAVVSIASKIGCTAQTLNEWVKKAEDDGGKLGLISDMTARLKALEGENRALRQLMKSCAGRARILAQGQLDRRHKP